MTIGFSAGAVTMGVGCQTTPPATQSNTGAVHGDVTDVRPVEPAAPAAYQPPLYDTTGTIPTAAQPVTAVPATPSSETPMVSTTPSVQSIGETKHVVRRGDTLFSIARASYGNGKQWKKIAAANPGVSASHLKVGQVLVIPQS
jgi:5'-nucleotidase